MTSSSPAPPYHHLPTVVSIAIVTYTSAIMLHEGAHAVAGVVVGMAYDSVNAYHGAGLNEPVFIATVRTFIVSRSRCLC